MSGQPALYRGREPLYDIDRKAFDPYWNESHHEALADMIEAGYIRERKPVEPVGTFTVTGRHDDGLRFGHLDLPPGEYLIVPVSQKPGRDGD